MLLRIFITGASSGIGRALCREYAQAGAVLGAAARGESALLALSDELKTLGAKRVYCYPLDVADEVALAAAAADFIAQEGAPDVLIANAGVSSGTLTECPEDLAAFHKILLTNVYGMAATFSPFIAAMKESAAEGRAVKIVGIASVAGIRGLPGAEAYSASKAAAITYLESLRLEMRRFGIRVVTIVPGYIQTPMTAVNTYSMPFMLPADEAAKRFIRAIDAGRSYAVIPWQMGVVAKILRLLPNSIYDRLFANAPRKSKVLS